MMQEFTVNKYITLKLENNKTFIYINNRRFLQCIRLVLQIAKENISDFDQINSIDEAAAVYKTIRNNRIMERNQPHSITPDQEFLGHCSNIQAWAEHNYDTRILHSNISFPLLRELTKLGDPVAKRVFKEEIGKRFMSGYEPVKKYLAAQGYLDYLNKDELEAIGASEYQTKYNQDNLLDKLREIFLQREIKQQLKDKIITRPNNMIQEFINMIKEEKPIIITLLGPMVITNNRWRKLGGGAVA